MPIILVTDWIDDMRIIPEPSVPHIVMEPDMSYFAVEACLKLELLSELEVEVFE